jgi:hypothetical protein
MSKGCWILFFVLLFSFASYSQNKSFASFIPKDYDTLYGGVARGDLNKDGIEDVVLALYHKAEKNPIDTSGMDTVPPRILIILLGSKNGFIKITESSSALLCKDCGGVFGDPFAGIEVKKSVLSIYHYGGSSWKWSYTHKFRFQNGDFYLIGETNESFWSLKQCEKLNEMAGLNHEDINFITGQFERKRISEDCKLLENKKGKQKVEPLIPLSKFTIEN